MPLVRAKDGDIALLQQDILTVRHAVQLALIHIGQFRHGMGFTGKEEALLPLLIKEGIQSLHTDLMIHPNTVARALAHLTGLGLSGHGNRCLTFEGNQNKIHTLMDTDGLIQIELPEILPIL